MQGNNTISQIFKGALLHAHFLHHLKQLFLCEEPFDGLDEVLVTCSVVGDDFSHFWDYVERVLAVDLFEDGVLDLGELQAHETSAGF